MSETALNKFIINAQVAMQFKKDFHFWLIFRFIVSLDVCKLDLWLANLK